MTTDTSERGLERLICTALAGHACDPPQAGQVSEPHAGYGGVGWSGGSSHDYDREFCVDRVQLAAFLRATQPEAAESLALDEDSPTRRKFLARLQGEITKRGTIDVLRHGGKSNSIAWLAHQLIGLAKDDASTFDSIIVVTNGIERAIQYFDAIRDYLQERKSQYRAIVAFSGEPEFGGEKVTEASLNGFPSGQIADKIQQDPYRFQNGPTSRCFGRAKSISVRLFSTRSSATPCHSAAFNERRSKAPSGSMGSPQAWGIAPLKFFRLADGETSGRAFGLVVISQLNPARRSRGRA